MRTRIQRLIERLRGEGLGTVLARGASAFLAIHVAGVFIALGSQVVLARAMGAEGFGTYVWAYNWLALLTLFCRMGLGTGSLRYVAAFEAREDWPSLHGYLRMTWRVVLVASAAVMAAAACATLLLGERLGGATQRTLLVACLALPVYAFLQLWSHVLRGFKRVSSSQVPGTLVQPALLGLAALAVPALGFGPLGAPEGMGLNLAAASAALAITGIALRRTVPSPVRSAPPRADTAEWLRTAFPLLVANFLNVARARVDILLLGSLAGASAAGIYAPAGRVAGVITFGLLAVNAWVPPLISAMHARGDRKGLERLMRLSAQGVFAFTLPLFLAVLLFGDRVLALFGDEFVAGYRALVILAGGQLVNALVGPVGYLMTMTGHQNAAAWIMGVHLVLGVGLNALLIPRYGFEGAAVATALTNTSWNLVMAVAVWRTLRLRATIL